MVARALGEGRARRATRTRRSDDEDEEDDDGEEDDEEDDAYYALTDSEANAMRKQLKIRRSRCGWGVPRRRCKVLGSCARGLRAVRGWSNA